MNDSTNATSTRLKEDVTHTNVLFEEMRRADWRGDVRLEHNAVVTPAFSGAPRKQVGKVRHETRRLEASVNKDAARVARDALLEQQLVQDGLSVARLFAQRHLLNPLGRQRHEEVPGAHPPSFEQQRQTLVRLPMPHATEISQKRVSERKGGKKKKKERKKKRRKKKREEKKTNV